MAKRRSARQVDRDDGDAEDDGYAWDSPPKKKKKKKKKSSSLSGSAKKSSSARKSARTSGTAKKTSSVRKSASGSARSKASGRRSSGRKTSDDGMNTSGRRRRAAPAKKKDDSTVKVVSAISITLLVIVGVVVFNKSRAPAPQVNHQNELESARTLLEQGKAKFREYNAAKQAGQPSQHLYKEALNALQNGIDQLGQVLQKPEYVDAEGFTRPEYEGYETELSEAAQLIIDLEKGGSLH